MIARNKPSRKLSLIFGVATCVRLAFAKKRGQRSPDRSIKPTGPNLNNPGPPTSSRSSSTQSASPNVQQPARYPKWFGYLAIGLLALSIRGVYFWELSGQLPFSTLITDSRVYHEWAVQIVNGNWLGDQVFYQSPLYPYTMAGIYKLTGADAMAVRWVQALLGSLACVMVAVAGRAFFGATAGLIAGAMLAIYAPAIFFDGLVQKSSLDLFFYSTVLCLMGVFLQRQNWWVLGAMGVSLGLLMLNRENARLLFPVIVLWLIVYFGSRSVVRRLSWVVWMGLGCGLVMLPVGWRNYYVGGEFLISTSQLGPNLYIGNHEGATGLYEPLVPGRSHTMHERVDAVRLAEEAQGRSLTAGEVSDYWRERAINFAVRSPVTWIRLMAWKCYLVLHAQELVDSEGIEVYARHSLLLRVLAWFNFGVLVPLAVLGIWGTRSDWRRLGVLYVSLLVLAGSVALFFVFARYRYPLVPVLILFAAAGLQVFPKIIHDWNVGSFWRTWAPGCVVCLALIVPLNWPLPQYRDDAIAYANYGKELLEAGQLQLSASALQRAIEISPNAPGPQYNLGRVLELQGQVAQAVSQYEAALQIDPGYGLAYWMLGRQQVASGYIAPGLQRLRKAAELLPEIANLRVDYGEALLRTDQTHGAVEQFRAALRIDPSYAAAANNLTWLLATSPDQNLRDAAEALRWAKLLQEVDDPNYLDTAAAAYAENGQFDQAVELAQRGSLRAQAAGNAELADRLAERVSLYQSKQPLRDTVKSP